MYSFEICVAKLLFIDQVKHNKKSSPSRSTHKTKTHQSLDNISADVLALIRK